MPTAGDAAIVQLVLESADIPAGTSTELRRKGNPASVSADGSVADEPRRTGVRCGERVGAEGDHPGHAEPSGELADGGGEAVPRHVGLRPPSAQHVPTVRVPTDLQLRRVPHQPGVHAVAQLQHRPAGPVVDEHVVVERDQRRGAARRSRSRSSPTAAAALASIHPDSITMSTGSWRSGTSVTNR